METANQLEAKNHSEACECGCTEFTRFGWASVTETIDFATDEVIQMEVDFASHLNGGSTDFRCCECDKVKP